MEGKLGLINQLTAGLIETLEKRSGVSDIKLVDRRPATSTELSSWERRHRHTLPIDLKSFYQTTDGLKVTWKLEFNGTSAPLGRVNINSLPDLKRLPGTPHSHAVSSLQASIADIDSEDEEDALQPHFDHRSDLFELDSCLPYGTVVLVYSSRSETVMNQLEFPRVWFLDRALQWHLLADSFASYFRLSVLHLGLPEWQNLFTTTGLSPASKKWFYLLAPERLRLDETKGHRHWEDDKQTPASNDIQINSIDMERVQKTRLVAERSKSRPPGGVPKPATAAASSKPRSASAAITRSNTSLGLTQPGQHVKKI
eukprot:m.25025 g.25025  ORF g.25025 m.25025 type:complete len:312 (+) comp28714_c0_seq4:28-963(+)